MKKQLSTKRALAMSFFAIFLCLLMLLTTTFAWFTDFATSSGNKIVSGKLKIDLELLDKAAGWVSIKESNAPLFNYEKWEPGYVDVKILKIENEGSLALKWKDKFISERQLSALADVIDVYVLPSATALSYPADRTLSGYTKVGTVADFVNTIETTTTGNLLAGEAAYLGIALKMQESAGNEFQSMDLGGAFDIQILATQLTSEEDSFGSDYDNDANFVSTADTMAAFFAAIENGDDVLLSEALVVGEELVTYMNERYPTATYALSRESTVIDKNVVIDGNGITVYRTEQTANLPLFTVESGYTLTLTNITLDGGAKWVGPTDPVLLRATTNTGMTTSNYIISTNGNGSIVLEEGAVIQNNDGAGAISLSTRGQGTLTINGGEVINNNGGGAGAIWGGGNIVMNDGKLNGNTGGIGGVVRTVDGQGGRVVKITINGGEIKNNKATTGGVIWSGNNLDVYFNGGEIAYNYAESGGGVIWGGSADKYVVAGDAEFHDNVAGELGNVIRMNHYKWPSLTITGGKFYNNDAESGQAAIYALNNPVNILGGYIDDDILFTGNDYLTVGNAQILGSIHCQIGLNVNQVKLTADFAAFSFSTDEMAANFAAFNLKPADGYVYTPGDEAKLVCLNEGYVTYWDAASASFKIQTIQ